MWVTERGWPQSGAGRSCGEAATVSALWAWEKRAGSGPGAQAAVRLSLWECDEKRDRRWALRFCNCRTVNRAVLVAERQKKPGEKKVTKISYFLRDSGRKQGRVSSEQGSA